MCHRVLSCRHRLSATSFNGDIRSRLRLGEAGRSIRRGFVYAALLSVLLAAACPWTNGQDPSVVGQFSAVMSWPYNPTHAVLLPNGEVLWWGSFSAGGITKIWNPASNTNTAVTLPGYNIFCGGHSLMESGQVFVTGGDAADSTGMPNASTLDPVSGNWTFLPNMNAGRWYPTNTVLPNGDILVTSGEISPTLGNDTLPQVWQVSSGTWRNLTTAQFLLPLYPQMYVAPNGTLFFAGPTYASEYLNTDGTGSWTIGPTMQFGQRGYGPSVMYNNGQIIAIGGGPPTATAETINLNAPVPAWTYTSSMLYARRHANATLLPDGTVLVTGGTSGSVFDDYTNPVFPDELWNPATGTWSTLASLSVYRGYHSVALLLPDGRVLSGGGECTANPPCDRNSAEIFSPPYLFAGARPTITSAPSSIEGGQTFFVATPNAANITQVSWIRLGAVTHTFNQEQRISFLSFSQATGGLDVTAPPSANLAPPGYYMLFLLSSGVPSVASIIQVDNSSFAQNGPAVSLSRTAEAFAATLVGTTTASRAVTLTNLGTTPVTINSVTAGADYTVTSNTCGGQLAPGNCTINVAFKPTTGGQLNEFLTINDSDSSSPQTVALSGLGKALKTSVTTLNMGTHLIGVANGAPLPVTLTNVGTTPISISSIGYPNPEFSQYLPSSTCGASLPGLGTCQVYSIFTPTAPGPQTGSISVVDSDPSSPSTISLTGAGLALKFSALNVIFGGLNLGLTHSPVALTLTNLGPVTVNFSSIAIGGTNPGDFGILTNTCGTALGAAANCSLGVTFTPQAAGARSATLTFTDDTFESPQNVSLAGTGVAVLKSIAVTPAQPSVAIGGTQQLTATGTYNNATTSNITASATWSSSNTGMATISNTSGSQGLASGVALGATTITATVNTIKGSTSLAVQNGTTTVVSSNNNPSTSGQAVQFTATVLPSTATGTVQFLDSGNLLGTGTLSGGAASFTTSSLTSGSHNITAVYMGDTNDTGSTSALLVEIVN